VIHRMDDEALWLQCRCYFQEIIMVDRNQLFPDKLWRFIKTQSALPLVEIIKHMRLQAGDLAVFAHVMSTQQQLHDKVGATLLLFPVYPLYFQWTKLICIGAPPHRSCAKHDRQWLFYSTSFNSAPAPGILGCRVC
jgi:hypothetical protein